MAKRPGKRAFPTRDELIDYIRDNDRDLSRREIARAFGVTGPARNQLKAMLRELEDDGVLERRRGRRYGDTTALPAVTALEVVALDPDGDPLARPMSWPDDEPAPTIYVVTAKRDRAPGVGDRILARLTQLNDGGYEARVMKRLGRAESHVLGVFTATKQGGFIESTNRRDRHNYIVPPAAVGDAKTGNFVRAELTPGRRYGAREAKIKDVLGHMDDPGSASLIAIHSQGIPTEFSPGALEEAAAAGPAPMDKRTDLRDLPLVTIDDADARDFDDAVWAERDTSDQDKPGWHIVVAIADVSWYVRPGSALDRGARERGNSVYFPDRVVPMLPEELSNGLCSLKPREDRPCMAVHMWIDDHGRKRRHEFVRGMMRSAARLTYHATQAARDGKADEETAPLVDDVIAPLYGAYEALKSARDARGVLDLDLPERKVVFDEEGRIARFETRERLDSHKLIEEFMILANVAAAETLERRKLPCMYRVHDQPTPEKLEALREYAGSLGFRLAKGQVMTADHFNRLLQRARKTPHADAVSEAVLRSQCQALYDPENIGHFGLALRRYAHFTSPIRRYSDLLVHRALITALEAGSDGLEPEAAATFGETAEHISVTERRAATAERDTMDRLAAAYMVDREGQVFPARISGVSRAGVFVRLNDIGADGLVPMSTLGPERFQVEEGLRVTGSSSGRQIGLGDSVRVRLEDVNTTAGRMSFTLQSEGGRRTALGKRKPRAGGPPRRRGGRR